MNLPNRSSAADWPDIPYLAWRDTCQTLHLMTQVIGKIRLEQTPWVNHSWHVPLYVTSRGLGTSPIAHGARSFEIDFDFVDHRLDLRTADGERRSLDLVPRAVADFYAAVIALLRDLDLPVSIHRVPSEIADAIPFDRDTEHGAYDADAVHRFWRALVQVDRVLKEFRAGFLGKSSPVHFFWGSFDMAVTRFSGRPAPPHPGGVPNFPDWVAREAYSHEVSSAGFWPGGGGIDAPSFYSYAYPAPDGFAEAEVRPAGAVWSDALGEFVLAYDDVRTADDPDAELLAFLESTYDAAADLGAWRRDDLERGEDPRRGRPRAHVQD